MKTYTLEVVINEGSDEFWEDINKDNSSGCDDVVDSIKNIFTMYGWIEPECTVRLTKFENKEDVW